MIVAVTEVIALGLVKSPGEMGADIVAAEGQSLGNSLNFGGPYVGLLATRDKFVRQMPGRLVGQTVDAAGKRGFVLTLSAREQHIRREKATSNICTNAALCALAFTHPSHAARGAGLRRLAEINHANACDLADRLGAVKGVEIVTPAFFNEFTMRVPGNASDVVDRLVDEGVLGGVPWRGSSRATRACAISLWWPRPRSTRPRRQRRLCRRIGKGAAMTMNREGDRRSQAM